VGVPIGRTFIINPKGELRKAEFAVQSSALSSLRAINELVGNIFPPLPPHVSALSPIIPETMVW
jgi:phosphatidate phosphatase PAH1